MAQILNMHIHTRPSDLNLLASSKHKANLSLLKKNSSVSYKSKRPNSHIASSLGQNAPSIATKSRIIKPADITIERSMFPPDFKFGAGSAAYQVEGAWNEGGRGPSIWDTYTHKIPSKIEDKSDGDVATDSYHRYKDDVKLLKKLGLDSYRFSISWPRILPDGTVKGGVNPEGIMYYNNLINELIKNDITPFVTLFHWDVPQDLEDKYQGFLSEKIVDDFKDYCQVCFREFGDRVKHWTTLNEPWTFSCLGYSLGRHAPGRGSPNMGCQDGDSMTEPYIATHNLILAHGTAARLYKDHFQSIQGGEIGIVINSLWYEPYDLTKPEDQAAALRAVVFMVGWYMDPLTKGEYPTIMRELVGKRLPVFDEKQSEMIKGSFDFIGLNYYSSMFAKDNPDLVPSISIQDNLVEQLDKDVNGKPIGELEGSWIYVFPDGMKNLLAYAKTNYNNPKIYVTENGTAQLDPNPKLPVEEVISDMKRIDYMKLHLLEISKAIEDEGVNVQGYYVWSLTDNFEWDKGYIERYGLHYIDYENNLARIPKKSVEWYNQFLQS